MTTEDDEIYKDGYRRAHGKQAESHAGGVVEVPPWDEQPAPTPAPAPPSDPTGPNGRRSDGTVTREGARALSARAAEARARRKMFAEEVMRLRVIADETEPLYAIRHQAQPFADQAEKLLQATVEEVNLMFDGESSAGQLSLAKTFAHQQLQGQMLMELYLGPVGHLRRGKGGGDVNAKTMLDLVAAASKLLDSARQTRLALHHLARLESIARRERDAHERKFRDPLAAYMRPLPPAVDDDETSNDTEDQ